MVYRIAPGDAVRPDPGRRPAFGLLENQGKGEIKDSSGKTSSLPPLWTGEEGGRPEE